jgi:hypothetical protein
LPVPAGVVSRQAPVGGKNLGFLLADRNLALLSKSPDANVRNEKPTPLREPDPAGYEPALAW